MVSMLDALAMSDLYYEINCVSDGTRFIPRFVWRLERSKTWLNENCKYQDLMTGTCPECGIVRFMWMEIDHVEEMINTHSVNTNNHGKWMARVQDEEARRIKRNKFSGSVNGSLNVFPWSFRGLIPLEL